MAYSPSFGGFLWYINVGEYTIHGYYGLWLHEFQQPFETPAWRAPPPSHWSEGSLQFFNGGSDGITET